MAAPPNASCGGGANAEGGEGGAELDHAVIKFERDTLRALDAKLN
jgi:hypothetical protein